MYTGGYLVRVRVRVRVRMRVRVGMRVRVEAGAHPLQAQPLTLTLAHVLGVGLEGGELARLELGGEARVVGPEEADVGDGEEHHRQPLEAETERPAWSGLGLVLGLG